MSGLNQLETATQPDGAGLTNGRMPDRGPRYTETPLDPYAPNAPAIAEPWNAITAFLFILIVFVWVWRLRGRYRNYPFLCCCMPILLAGGIGGTLYHATRASSVFLVLDFVPIMILGFTGSMSMAIRYWGRRGWWFLPAVCLFYASVRSLFFAVLQPTNIQFGINLSYASLAAVVLIPIGLVLLRTRFRHGGWVVAAVISFAIAWFFRLVDRDIASELPMGSHWLWHTFGAITTFLIIEYFYLVEGERSRIQQSLGE